MTAPFEPDRLEPVPAPPPPRPPRSRAGRHAALLVVTLGTLAFAGGTFWSPAEGLLLLDDWDLFRFPNLLRVIGSGLTYAICTLLVLGAHEMGHYLACRRYGIPATLPFFIPGIPPIGSFGAVIRIRGRIPDRRALFDVAAAGPIAGYLVAAPLLVAGVALARPGLDPTPVGAMVLGKPVLRLLIEWVGIGPRMVEPNALFGAGWVGMLVTSLNLFPVGQLDGGHAAYALSRTLHRKLARATLVGMLAMIVYQGVTLRSVPAYTLWFLILLWMRDRHPRLLDESTTLGPGRRLVAIVLAAIFVSSFIALPLSIT